MTEQAIEITDQQVEDYLNKHRNFFCRPRQTAFQNAYSTPYGQCGFFG